MIHIVRIWNYCYCFGTHTTTGACKFKKIRYNWTKSEEIHKIILQIDETKPKWIWLRRARPKLIASDIWTRIFFFFFSHFFHTIPCKRCGLQFEYCLQSVRRRDIIYERVNDSNCIFFVTSNRPTNFVLQKRKRKKKLLKSIKNLRKKKAKKKKRQTNQTLYDGSCNFLTTNLIVQHGFEENFRSRNLCCVLFFITKIVEKKSVCFSSKWCQKWINCRECLMHMEMWSMKKFSPICIYERVG